MTLAIRPFAPADEEAVLALRLRSFEGLDEARERERARWLAANPFRDPAVPDGWVAEHAGALVGHYGILPCALGLDGVQRPALCGVDFCVDPGSRRLGLGLQLTRRFVTTPGRELFFVTSPTPAAAELMRYCGAAVLDGEADASLLVLSAAAAATTPRGGVGIRLEEVEAFDARFDALAVRLAARRGIAVWRDARYLAWRYGAYPFARARVIAASRATGTLAGFAALLPDEALGRGYLCELCVPDDDEAALDALAAEATVHARAQGWSELYALHRDPAARRALERAGFQRVVGHGRRYVLHVPRAPERLADWYLTAGDGDVLFGVGG